MKSPAPLSLVIQHFWIVVVDFLAFFMLIQYWLYCPFNHHKNDVGLRSGARVKVSFVNFGIRTRQLVSIAIELTYKELAFYMAACISTFSTTAIFVQF